MLSARRATAFLVSVAVALGAGSARAQDEDSGNGLRRPERLTSGIADQFLGQLAPDGRTLYFLSNRDTTDEIYVEDTEEGRARLLFDEDAEVTWPRVSPDGRSLLYISFRDRAIGQLCIRDLPGGGHRRCLGDPSAAIQAEWIDRERIALVARATLQGDLTVLRVQTGSELAATPLLTRNLTSPAVSPDGRWLVYVPLERYVERIGPSFAARAAPRLEATRIDGSGEPAVLRVDLPGLTGQPVFSRDGRSLYVVQFFSDSNHDGVVDARDHGVLFRLPFTQGESGAPALGTPEQLTDTTWNCQYPAPSAGSLIATCAAGKSLQVYLWPIDGEVPPEWTPARLAIEVELTGSREEQQLLFFHWLAREPDLAKRRRLMTRLVTLHLELDEVKAAEFYARAVGAIHDPVTAGIAQPLLLLTEHREAVRRRERGRLLGDFGEEARARLDALGPRSGDSPAATALRHIVRSEVADTLGDKAMARTELEAVAIEQGVPRSVLEIYYERADALYRELDDRDALVAAGERLARSHELDAHDQLGYARAAVRALIRGLPYDEADALLVHERASRPGDSELAFALDLGRRVLAVRVARPTPAVREALLALYAAQVRPDRRHAVVAEGVQRAAQVLADQVTEDLVQRYVVDVPRGTDEWRRVERLYRRTLAGRAYRRLEENRPGEARADFDALVEKTGSFEGLLGSVDLRLKAGEAPSTILAGYERRSPPLPPPLRAFTKAYLRAAELPTLEGDAHVRRIAEVLATLRSSWPELKARPAAQALYGAVLHEEYLRTGELDAAERASSHYLVALDLGNNPRYRARVLGELGLLHTEVGNYRIALGYLESRDALPVADDTEGLAVRLASARALLHVGREEDAATTADLALAMVERAPTLASYRVLALDRAALCNLAARRFGRALALYDAEVPRVDAPPGPATERNRFVTRLARAAAALGAGQPERALQDVVEVDRRLHDARWLAALAWPHATRDQVRDSYRRIAAGLRAGAHQALGQFDAAARDLEERRALLDDAVSRAGRGDPARALALVESQLAENASERHDLPAVTTWTNAALAHADALHPGRAAIDHAQLDVLWLDAALHAFTDDPPPADLRARLEKAHAEARTSGDRTLQRYERWFEIYEALTRPPAAGNPVPPESPQR